MCAQSERFDLQNARRVRGQAGAEPSILTLRWIQTAFISFSMAYTRQNPVNFGGASALGEPSQPALPTSLARTPELGKNVPTEGGING